VKEEEEQNWEKRIFWKLSQGTVGTVVAGNFGLGGQETARIPRARELERLFLVGGRLIFDWAVWASTRTSEPGTESTKSVGGGMHVTSSGLSSLCCCYYDVIINMLLCCCYHVVVFVVVIMLLAFICCCCLFLV
jgi:hypothetical protein